jgi:hypothetical protein
MMYAIPSFAARDHITGFVIFAGKKVVKPLIILVGDV